MYIDPVKWLFDVLLGREERLRDNREQRFRELFESMFHVHQQIHQDYVEMLRKCENMLPLLHEGNWYAQKPEWRKISELEISVEVAKVKSEWQSLREVAGAERVLIRTRATELIKSVSEPIERNFVLASIYYFIHPERGNYGSELLSSFVKSLIERGPDKTLGSPSLTVWERIEHKKAPEDIREIFSKHRMALFESWTSLSAAYTKLYISHVQHRR